MPCDGTFPTGTAKWEKRNLATEVPCGIRTFASMRQVRVRLSARDDSQQRCLMLPTIMRPKPSSLPTHGCPVEGEEVFDPVAVEDCTGCGVCVDVCPARNKSKPNSKRSTCAQAPLREAEVKNWDYFLDIPELDRRTVSTDNLRGIQATRAVVRVLRACAGCGETPLHQTAYAIIRRPHGCVPTPRVAPRSMGATCRPLRHAKQGRARAGLVQLALRGQRRIRSWLPGEH